MLIEKFLQFLSFHFSAASPQAIMPANKFNRKGRKMAKSVKVSFKSPLGELRWVNIGQGGIDTSMEKDGSKMQKVASVYLTGEAKDKAITELNTIWENFKTELGLKKGVQAKSTGYKIVIDKETGEETGEISLNFKTNAQFKDGKENNIRIYNSKGVEVDLGDKKIGNGSIGIIHGEAAYYDAAGSKGITLYLKAIQLKSFVEYTENIDALDISEDGDFQGVNEDGGIIPF